MIQLQSESWSGPIQSGLPKSRRVALPEYDRDCLIPGVVHIGVGAFHRAHQAVYFDELAAQGVVDWGVIGICVRSHKVADALAAQNNMFTVVQRQGSDCSARVVGSVLDVTVLAEDPDGVRRRLADPTTRLVTLTITGDGYTVGKTLVNAGDSVFGVIARALDDRRRNGLAPFTVLSCDNLADSGAAAREAVLAHSLAIDPALAAWVGQSVTFPASMVDRITPGTTDDDRDWVMKEFAVDDLAPVMTEQFAQWVVEDAFCNSRPPLELVGVRFVDDVSVYKLIKSRMLNGAHCALAYLGYLAGYRRTDEAMQGSQLGDYVDWLLAEEIAPLLPRDVAGMDLDDYRRVVLQRLCNTAIADPLTRLCRRGTTKMSDYLLPSLTEAWTSGRPYQLLLVAAAAWMRYLRGTDLADVEVDVIDPRSDLIAQAAALPLDRGVRLIVDRLDAFAALRRDPTFLDELLYWVHALNLGGVDAVIGELVNPQLAS